MGEPHGQSHLLDRLAHGGDAGGAFVWIGIVGGDHRPVLRIDAPAGKDHRAAEKGEGGPTLNHQYLWRIVQARALPHQDQRGGWNGFGKRGVAGHRIPQRAGSRVRSPRRATDDGAIGDGMEIVGVVELRGIEPLTSAVRLQRSPI